MCKSSIVEIALDSANLHFPIAVTESICSAYYGTVCCRMCVLTVKYVVSHQFSRNIIADDDDHREILKFYS